MIVTNATPAASPTAAVCESMALYGASPERGEFDSREVWDADDAIDALGEAIRIVVDGITVEGTQLADEREALLWGFVNCLHSQVTRLDRTVDRITPEMKDLERAQDGTEVKNSRSFCPYRAVRRGSLPLAQLPRALCSPCRA